MNCMFRSFLLRSLVVGAMCGLALKASAETAIQPLREIHLPVPPSRGSYSHFPYSESARDHVAMRVAPDQSILVFDADASGKWPLVRVRKWWTENPASEVLNIPGWSAADSEHLAGIRMDVQITPDGRYAVAFSEALWMEKSSFLLHVPKGYVERKPDTIVTVVDLERWQIVKSLHTITTGDGDVRDARVVDNRWIALDANLGQSGAEQGTDRYRNWVLSIPDLKPGSECLSERFFPIGRPPDDLAAQRVKKKNVEACRDVLKATETDSDKALEVLIQRGSGIEPTIMRLRDVDWLEDVLERESRVSRSEKERLWDAEGHAMEFFRYWGEYPYYDQVAQNPPFESSAHLWYGLYSSHDRGLDDLVRYDAEGREQKTETARHLACGDPVIGKSNSACGCRVIDVSEELRTLLTYCRKQHSDYDGMFQMQWLSVFRSDDLSGIGFINLAKNSEALQAIASGDGQAYVVTLEFGEILRVYAVPDRPN